MPINRPKVWVVIWAGLLPKIGLWTTLGPFVVTELGLQDVGPSLANGH